MQHKLLRVDSVNIDTVVQLGPLIGYHAFLQYLVGWTNQELIKSWQCPESSVFSIVSKPKLKSTQPDIQWAPEAISPGVKRLWCESGQTPPSNAEGKND